MIGSTSTFTDADEGMHPADPGQWTWNESWFFSWIDLDGGPAGFFRLGVLPNQDRAMLWSFVNIDGTWLGIDEPRLALDDLDVTDGVVTYDRWGLRFTWRPEPGAGGARFTFDASCLARSGAAAGTYVPVSIDLTCRPTGERFGTVHGDDERESTYARSRFEQSLEASGVVVIGAESSSVRAGSHRDRSWGPREWRLAFTMGDLQAGDRQLYFVGAAGFPGGGYIREPSGALRTLAGIDQSIGYDDRAATITPGRLGFETGDGERVDIELAPIGPSVAFDMAHTCTEPETWLYYRTLVSAQVSGWDAPCRGWLDASRYGLA